jgi:hypothetical protein
MYVDVWIGAVYAGAAYVIKYFFEHAPSKLAWVEPVVKKYDEVALPFYGCVLFCVTFDICTETAMRMFYASRYMDYVQTLALIRYKRFRFFNLHVFHHSTVPTILRSSWDDRFLIRFVVFLVGSSAAIYASSNEQSQESLFQSEYLSELSPVQWTQYFIVLVHTIRTTNKRRRFWFGMYACVFIVCTYQYFHSFKF